MARIRPFICSVIILAGGCSSSDSPSTASGAPKSTELAARSLPSTTDTSYGKIDTTGGHEFATDTNPDQPLTGDSPTAAAVPDMANLFAAPVSAPVETTAPAVAPIADPVEPPAPDPVKPPPLPQLRLMGFVEMEGVQAMLMVDGTIHVVAVGESAGGVDIVAIQPPSVTLGAAAQPDPFQLNLYDQPWFHHPSTLAGNRGQRVVSPAREAGQSVRPASPGSQPIVGTPPTLRPPEAANSAVFSTFPGFGAPTPPAAIPALRPVTADPRNLPGIMGLARPDSPPLPAPPGFPPAPPTPPTR